MNGVVYEPSKQTTTQKPSKKPDANLVAKLKAESDARVSQLKSLVEQMISKQGQTLGKQIVSGVSLQAATLP